MTHSRVSRWIVPFLISCLLAAPAALAQESAQQKTKPAPQTPAASKPTEAPPNAVQPKPVVKATESKPDSEETHKLVGLRINLLPLVAGLIVGKGGIYSLGTEVRIIDQLSIGPNFAYTKLTIDDKTLTSFSYGARLNWYMSGKAVGRGWYLSPYFTVVPLKASSTVNESGFDVPVETKHTASIVGATVGYQWMWDFGMTFNVGLGVFHMNVPTTLVLTGTSPLGTTLSQNFDLQQAVAKIPAILPEIEIGIGFAF